MSLKSSAEVVAAGPVAPPTAPGSGLRLDLERVRRAAFRHGRVG